MGMQRAVWHNCCARWFDHRHHCFPAEKRVASASGCPRKVSNSLPLSHSARVGVIADAVRWAERIIDEIDRRHPAKQEISRSSPTCAVPR
jgi:hypothetical protein